jgi:copper resistance protein C
LEQTMSLRQDARIAAAVIATGASIAFGGGQALAHAQLMHAEPAANASVSAPKTIVLHFNEALEAKVSSVKLTDIDGKNVAITAAAAPDSKSLAATPAALAPGLYTVNWTAVGDDGHPMKGTYSFTVK